MGGSTTASGVFSTAMGQSTTASGGYSTAMGRFTTASGTSSTPAMGQSTTASGYVSTAMGSNTDAQSGFETAIGRFNTTYTPSSTTGWDAADRLFVVGNGTTTARSNALIIWKDGKITINDSYDLPTTDGISGQVLTTDGAGTTSWSNGIC